MGMMLLIATNEKSIDKSGIFKTPLWMRILHFAMTVRIHQLQADLAKQSVVLQSS